MQAIPVAMPVHVVPASGIAPYAFGYGPGYPPAAPPSFYGAPSEAGTLPSPHGEASSVWSEARIEGPPSNVKIPTKEETLDLVNNLEARVRNRFDEARREAEARAPPQPSRASVPPPYPRDASDDDDDDDSPGISPPASARPSAFVGEDDYSSSDSAGLSPPCSPRLRAPYVRGKQGGAFQYETLGLGGLRPEDL